MKKKILVIDDDPKIVLALQIRLKSADYEVLTAADGVKGLLMALELKPDLVIADIMMPLGGGFSMAYRLREKAPEVPLIFITASKQQALRKMADNLGAAGFLEKPFLQTSGASQRDGDSCHKRPDPPLERHQAARRDYRKKQDFDRGR